MMFLFFNIMLKNSQFRVARSIDYSGYKNINYENQKETEFTNNYSRIILELRF